MGHVIDSEKCEQCGRARYISYNYKTQEEYDTCTVCGKTYKLFIKRDEEGNIVYDKTFIPGYPKSFFSLMTESVIIPRSSAMMFTLPDFSFTF
jgi:hypothetical protein